MSTYLPANLYDGEDYDYTPQRRKPACCPECGVYDGHNAGCPADDQDEGDEDE